MPTFNSQNLLKDLQNDVKILLQQLDNLGLDDASYNQQPAAGKWSVAQVLEHLNSYNRFYLPAINNALKQSNTSHNPVFKSGWFGNYFTNMMLPKTGGKIANKMQAPKDHRPVAELNSARVVQEFREGCHTLLNYLIQAESVDISQIRVPISISKMIKLKLGGTFRFLIAHQQRHFIQIHNTLAALQAHMQGIATA